MVIDERTHLILLHGLLGHIKVCAATLVAYLGHCLSVWRTVPGKRCEG